MASDGLVIIGAGGHAKVLISSLKRLGRQIECLVDDDSRRWNTKILGISITGPIAKAPEYGGMGVLAIGDNFARKRLSQKLRMHWVTVIDPTAHVHESVQIGSGSVVFAGAVLQPDVVLGDHAIVNTAATVDHDCRIENYVHLAPGVNLAGSIRVQEGAFIGIGSSILPGLTIGAWTFVGAGAAVVNNVPNSVVAVGVPAKVLRKVSQR